MKPIHGNFFIKIKKRKSWRCIRNGKGMSLPLNLWRDRIILMVSLWCSAHELFKGISVWFWYAKGLAALLHELVARVSFFFSCSSPFVLSLLRISYPPKFGTFVSLSLINCPLSEQINKRKKKKNCQDLWDLTSSSSIGKSMRIMESVL